MRFFCGTPPSCLKFCGGVVSPIFLDAAMLYLMATNDTIMIGYAAYIVASFEIASNISQNSYGLVPLGTTLNLSVSFRPMYRQGYQMDHSISISHIPTGHCVIY